MWIPYLKKSILSLYLLVEVSLNDSFDFYSVLIYFFELGIYFYEYILNYPLAVLL